MKNLHPTRGTTLGLLLVAALALPFLGACVTHTHAAHTHRPGAGGVRVIVAKGHVHSTSCGHYRHRGHWYHLRGHAHSHRCGHAFVGGVWVLRP